MAVNYLRSCRKKAYDHLLAFAEQTVLHGPKYFLNRGAIKTGVNNKTGRDRKLKISRFDR